MIWGLQKARMINQIRDREFREACKYGLKREEENAKSVSVKENEYWKSDYWKDFRYLS